MDEVVAADGGGIAIAHHHYDLELWFGKLYPGGEGKGSPVGSMKGIEIHIYREPTGTADT